jgi:hypothetical protein
VIYRRWIKEVDHSKSRIYRELPELLSSFPNATFLEAHMWYSRPLDDLFLEISRPLKEALGSWLLTHAPQKLSNVRIIDERQAAPCPPFWQNVYEFKAETQISRCEEARDELAISPDQLDCAFTYLKLEQESEFESLNQSRAFSKPPFNRFCIRFCTDISNFDEAEGDAVGDEHDGNNDDPSPPATTGSAAALGGYSLAAALLPPADIMDMEYISDMEEYW